MDGKKRDHPEVEYYRKMHCPLVENPLPRCHCNSPKSMNIYSIIHYCGDNFGECPIYQEHLQQGEDGCPADTDDGKE